MHGITFLNRWALAIAPLAGFALLASPAHAGIAVEKVVTEIRWGGEPHVQTQRGRIVLIYSPVLACRGEPK